MGRRGLFLFDIDGLKVDKYGKTVMSKSQHSSKEVPQFLYNDKGVQILSGILGKAVKTA